jgi:hypothetical protein
MPINPALLKHADQRRQHLENRIADTITRFAAHAVRLPPHPVVRVWNLSGVEHYPDSLRPALHLVGA